MLHNILQRYAEHHRNHTRSRMGNTKQRRAISRACSPVQSLESRLLLSYTFNALASFVSTGNQPTFGLVQDTSGNLYGITSIGGAYDDGSLVEIPQGTAQINMLNLFDGSNGANPDALTINSSNNTIYGTTASGDSGSPTLFQYANSAFATLHTFSTATDGSAPDALVVNPVSGIVYGTTNTGGAHGDGTLFEYNPGAPSSSAFTTLWSFSGASDGANPSGGLLLDGNGNLDGTTKDGATGNGIVFQFNLNGPANVTSLHTFAGTDGADPNSLVLSNGNLYGTTYAGGTKSDGTVFQIVGGAFSSLHSFTGGTNGANPQSVILDSSGNIYGTTFAGGTEGIGSVFEISKLDSFSTLASFDAATTGINPQGNLVLSAGMLYGTANNGGALYEGSVFQFNPGTSALTALVAFGAPTGDASMGDMVPDSSGHFFGTGGAGGIDDNAAVWEFNPTNNAITAAGMFAYNGDDGASPTSLAWDSSNNTLYGTAQYAGALSDSGTLFDIVNGNAVALHSFDVTDGTDPNALILVNGVLYGTTQTDGTGGHGTIFQYNLATNAFTSLASFNGTNGANPSGNLVLGSDGDIYGITSGGGTSNDGTIFKFNPSSPGIISLHSFSASDGADPSGDIALDSNNDVFGTTQDGGVNGSGSVYEFAAGTLTTVYSFGTNAGHYDPNGVLLDSSGNLFGTTFNGGADFVGMDWEISGGAFSVLYSFTGASDGANPAGGLYEDPTGNLWGTTEDAGNRYVGTVYELTTSSPIPTTPHLAFTQQPQNAMAGNTISPSITVAIENASGVVQSTDTTNVTVALTTPTGAVLYGTPTQQAQGGVATFGDLSLQLAGTYTLTASDTTDGLPTVTSTSFTISPATASQLVYVQSPTNALAGATISPAVTLDVEDQFNNLETTDHSTVALAASGPGSLGGTTSATISNGVATFSKLSITTAGLYTLIASDVTDKLSGFASLPFTISTAALSKMVYTTMPTSTTAGAPLVSVVTLEDKYGNIETTDNTSNVTLTPSKGALSGTPIATTTAGVATFTNISLTLAGAYTLTASDTPDGLANVASGSFTISPALATQLVYTTPPVNAVAGASLTVAVSIEDQYNNVETSDNTSSVTLAVNTGPGALSGTTTVLASKGVATFKGLSLITPGGYMLTASASPDGLSGFISNGFTISSAPQVATKLLFVQQPTNTISGVPITPAVTVEVVDSLGNIVTTNISSVTIKIASGRGGSLGGVTSVSVVGGIATFNDLVFSLGGNYTLTASDAKLTKATSNSFNVIGPAAKLVFIQQPGASTVNTAINPAVEVAVEDSSGDIVTSNTSTVTIALNSGKAGILSGTLSVPAVNGIAIFSNLLLNGTGSYRFRASDALLTSATSNSFLVSTAPAAPAAEVNPVGSSPAPLLSLADQVLALSDS